MAEIDCTCLKLTGLAWTSEKLFKNFTKKIDKITTVPSGSLERGKVSFLLSVPLTKAGSYRHNSRFKQRALEVEAIVTESRVEKGQY